MNGWFSRQYFQQEVLFLIKIQKRIEPRKMQVVVYFSHTKDHNPTIKRWVAESQGSTDLELISHAANSHILSDKSPELPNTRH